MEIVTEEQLKILSQLVIPIFLIFVSGVIPSYITKHSKKQDKIQHLNFLRTNFIKIDAYLIALQDYKARRLGISPMYLVFGILVSVLFGLIIDLPIKRVLRYILESDYVKKSFHAILHNFNELNGVLFYYSCYYIVSILIIFVVWIGWCKLLKSTGMGTPKITRPDSTNPKIIIIPSIKSSSQFVYLSLWSFLGIMVGFNFFMLLATLGMFVKYSIIPEDVSLSWTTFAYIYANLEDNVLYLTPYCFIFSIGAFLSFYYTIVDYQLIKMFSSEINQLITKYFMYDFPEVKIITENGEVKGQLRDILNKSIVTVSEKDKIKAISWDKIEIIEASKKDLKNDFRSP